MTLAMGYDCTFHLIDERAIREEFVPRLLGGHLDGQPGQTALDRVRQDAAELWAMARGALEDRLDADGGEMSSEDIAALLCRLAIIFSSCSLAHHHERELAFSLWNERAEPETAAASPFPFSHSPEPLFAEVVARHPHLGGKFPRNFNGDSTTGVYIPSSRAGEAADWLRGALAAAPGSRRRRYGGLLAMLDAARMQGAAFWEAAGLGVPSQGVFPGDPELMSGSALGREIGQSSDAARHALFAGGRCERCGGWGDLHVLTGEADDGLDVTLAVDLAQWPPLLLERKPEFVSHMDCDPAGGWLLVSRRELRGKGAPFHPYLLDDLANGQESTFDIRSADPIGYHQRAFFVSERILLVPPPGSGVGGEPVRALMDDGEKLIEAPGLPPLAKTGAGWHSPGVARTGDGADVLIWNGDGYEWDGDRFRKTFPLGAANVYDELHAVPGDGDGFFYLNNRTLFEAYRGGEPVRHAPLWTNIMHMLPGPDGGLLLREGENDDAAAGKLYFPAEGTFIRIEPELVGGSDLYDFLAWSQGAGLIVASDRRALYAVGVEEVLGLPREPAAPTED